MVALCGGKMKKVKHTSSLERALRSALYSMLTSALPPPVERYVYLEVLATAEEDIAKCVNSQQQSTTNYCILSMNSPVTDTNGRDSNTSKPACKRRLNCGRCVVRMLSAATLTPLSTQRI